MKSKEHRQNTETPRHSVPGVDVSLRPTGKRRLRYLLAALLLAPAWPMAQTLDTEEGINGAHKLLAELEQQLDSAAGTLQARRQASELKHQILPLRVQARNCIMDATAKLETLNTRHDALGPSSKGEDPELARLRRDLDADINRKEKQRAACEQITRVTQDLLDRIQAREQAALTAHLFARGVSTPGIVSRVFEDPLAWSRLVSGFLDTGSGWERISIPRRWSVLILLAVLTAAGMGWRRYWFSRHAREDGSRYLAKAFPWLLACAGTAVLLTAYLPEWPPPLIIRLVIGILGWLLIDIVLHIWIAGRQSAAFDEQDARSLARWMRIPVGLVIAGGLLTTAEAVIRLPDPHYFLLRTAMAWLLLVGLVWSAVILGRIPDLRGTRTLRVLLVLAALAIAVAETLGFRNLSVYLLVGFGGTAAGLGVFGFVSKTFVFLFDGLDEGRYAWQKSLRHWMELKPLEPMPGLIWLRLATSVFIWSGFALWVLWVWGQSERGIGRIVDYALNGFDIGSLHMAPAQIIGAIAVLAVGISLTRWLKQRVVTDLVKRSRLDRGGREAITTVSGYTGITISLLVALGVAGISYTNLAIVAGALSVGIGFGLQNVVNNFVSGLILLFERPVRTGDWVVVGDTQGYVRKISIRSTQIETFDRADVIVPNSELIASKVSNWMLRDPWGRITIPVGVAYGSDVEKVIKVLVGVANEHDGVLKDQPGVAPPKALFRRFGDSALEFELRCFIRQIDRAFDITSDLNIAIDRAFREAGITIPFPQRDIHVSMLPFDNGKIDP